MQMWKSIIFRGQSVKVTDKRVWRRDVTKYYYEIRHKDNDWSVPATLEENVSVNFYGTLSSPVRYLLDERSGLGGGFLKLTPREVMAIREAIEREGRDECQDCRKLGETICPGQPHTNCYAGRMWSVKRKRGR